VYKANLINRYKLESGGPPFEFLTSLDARFDGIMAHLSDNADQVNKLCVSVNELVTELRQARE
jgi:hypothetical protein